MLTIETVFDHPYAMYTNCRRDYTDTQAGSAGRLDTTVPLFHRISLWLDVCHTLNFKASAGQ